MTDEQADSFIKQQQVFQAIVQILQIQKVPATSYEITLKQ